MGVFNIRTWFTMNSTQRIEGPAEIDQVLEGCHENMYVRIVFARIFAEPHLVAALD